MPAWRLTADPLLGRQQNRASRAPGVDQVRCKAFGHQYLIVTFTRLFADDRNNTLDGNGIVHICNELGDDAGNWRFERFDRLCDFNFYKRLPLLDRIALPLEPLRNRSLGHVHSPLGHFDFEHRSSSSALATTELTDRRSDTLRSRKHGPLKIRTERNRKIWRGQPYDRTLQGIEGSFSDGGRHLRGDATHARRGIDHDKTSCLAHGFKDRRPVERHHGPKVDNLD